MKSNRLTGIVVGGHGLDKVAVEELGQSAFGHTDPGVRPALTWLLPRAVILDNLASHKGRAVRRAIRNADAGIWFLPACPPDLKPIEQTFAKIEHWMRDARKRSAEDAWRPLGHLIGTIQPDECRNHIRNAGYGSN